ncbi:hypothetical protein K1719_023913 [Acacia pycnantha]|nr:hypothetical protein K1719_023913 [Acacia pycnantha]
MISLIFFVFCFFSSQFSHQALALDFCVADYAAPMSPSGHSCKDPSKVTVNDFVFSGLDVSGNSSKIFKFGFKSASDTELPGLNGLGFSLGRADFEKGAVVPIHAHPDASEISLVLDGKVTFGFIASDNTVYQKSLVKGDVFVVPQGLMHYAFNEGDTPAPVIVGFSSSKPSVQLMDLALFRSNLASQVITSSTLIGAEEVKRLKAIFGGSG